MKLLHAALLASLALGGVAQAGGFSPGGSQSPQPVNGTITANPTPGVGAEAGTVQPTLGTLLASMTVVNAGQYYIQNQSAATLQVVYDDGNATAGTVSVQLIGPGAGANAQGGDTAPPIAWFTGRIRIYGAAGAQFMARHN